MHNIIIIIIRRTSRRRVVPAPVPHASRRRRRRARRGIKPHRGLCPARNVRCDRAEPPTPVCVRADSGGTEVAVVNIRFSGDRVRVETVAGSRHTHTHTYLRTRNGSDRPHTIPERSYMASALQGRILRSGWGFCFPSRFVCWESVINMMYVIEILDLRTKRNM